MNKEIKRIIEGNESIFDVYQEMMNQYQRHVMWNVDNLIDYLRMTLDNGIREINHALKIDIETNEKTEIDIESEKKSLEMNSGDILIVLVVTQKNVSKAEMNMIESDAINDS